MAARKRNKPQQDLHEIFKEKAERYLELKSEIERLDKEKKQLQTELLELVTQNGGKIVYGGFEASVTKRVTKKVKPDAPAILKDLLGEEAGKYLVQVEELPKDQITKLVNGGILTPEQADQLMKISVSEYPTVKKVKENG